MVEVGFLDTEGNSHRAVVKPLIDDATETFIEKSAEHLRATLDDALERRRGSPRMMQ